MTTPYADQTFANLYFGERLNADAWATATSADQVKALKMATVAIDRLHFKGQKADAAQANQFPRVNDDALLNPDVAPVTDVAVPADVQNACCELALELIKLAANGQDPGSIVDDQFVVKQQIGYASTQWDPSAQKAYLLAGIPSSMAWNFLVPYLRDPQQVWLTRG